MPARTFALLIGTVIALGGATLLLAHLAGLPMTLMAFAAMVGAIMLKVRR